MKTSSEINEIAKALNEAQKGIKDVFKGASGYNYKYATLDKVYDEIRPAMTANGLSLTHQKSFDRSQNVITLTSLLMHTGGQYIEYEASLPYAGLKGMNDYQSAGAGLLILNATKHLLFSLSRPIWTTMAQVHKQSRIHKYQHLRLRSLKSAQTVVNYLHTIRSQRSRTSSLMIMTKQ